MIVASWLIIFMIYQRTFLWQFTLPQQRLGEWQRGTPCSLGIGNFCVSNPTDVSSSPLEPYFVMAGQIKETK